MALPTQKQASSMKSDDFEYYVNEVQKIRPLTFEEFAFVKRTRRRMSNKVYAQNHRDNKNKRLTELQQKISDLGEVFDISRTMCFAVSERNIELEQKLRTLSENYYALFHGEEDDLTMCIDLARYNEPPVPYMPEDDGCTLSF